jgi:hypothetical protein
MKGTTAAYAALSYCWGGDQNLTATNRTMPHLLNQIDEQSLPPTLRDAVLVTENLGLRFLWVDALCILQDDEYDKSMEISQMPFIYRHATVTIVASRASEVGEGFLQKRPTIGFSAHYEGIRLAFQGSDGPRGSVAVIKPPRETVEPLEKRAWALQEHLLSPRILDYRTLKTQWLCRATDKDTAVRDGWHRGQNSLLLELQNSLQSETDDPKLLEDFRKTLKGGHRQWWQLVETYSRRDLTLALDRLPAISAMAERYERLLGDAYVAGHWRSRIVESLCWNRTLNTIVEPLPRPLVYQGPSWSWAGSNCSINRASEYEKTEECRYQASLVDCECHPKLKSARFGELRAAHITLEGCVQPASWTGKKLLPGLFLLRFNTRHDEAARSAFQEPPFSADCPILNADCLDEEFSAGADLGMPIYLLTILTYRDGNSCEGLALRRQSDGLYMRLGAFTVGCKEDVRFLTEGETQIVTIV